MSTIDSQILQIGTFDRLASQGTAVHRLDPRGKLIVTLVFAGVVVSVPTHDLGMLLPFASYPLFLVCAGDVPAGFLFRRLLLVSPFAVMLGAFNPIFDRGPQASVFGLVISAGWVSFGAILLRFALTVSAALGLIAVTGMRQVCLGLERLRVPDVFAVQLLLLYRYIFVLAEEALRMARARSLRAVGRRGLGLRSYAPLVGQLLMRTLARAERVHTAMRCRGFTGRIRTRSDLRWGRRDTAFVCTWLMLFAIFRIWNVPLELGRAVTRWMSIL
jgi:cobalt/nickel transport system permease protein